MKELKLLDIITEWGEVPPPHIRSHLLATQPDTCKQKAFLFLLPILIHYHHNTSCGLQISPLITITVICL